MSARHERLLAAARRAALAAGEAVMAVYAEAFDVRQKLDKTPVTEADLAAERIIIEILKAAAPDMAIVSEELVDAEGLPPSAERFWVVDPLDGTREFVAKNGEFSICIGLVEEGRPVLGVLHGPAVGVTYTAHGPGTATRQWRGRAVEPIQARLASPDGLVVVHSRSHENSRRIGEFLQHYPVRQRPQIRPDRGRRSRPLPALRHDHGMGHRRRAGDPRGRRRPRRDVGRNPARLWQTRLQKRRLYRLGPRPYLSDRADRQITRTPMPRLTSGGRSPTSAALPGGPVPRPVLSVGSDEDLFRQTLGHR